MHFVIILWFFPIFCWLRRLANADCPLLGKIFSSQSRGSTPCKTKTIPNTGSEDSEQFHCSVQKCHQSVHHNGTRCKGSNPCSVNYNILPRRGQWTLSNNLSQHNVTSCVRPGLCKGASSSASYCVRTLYYWFWNVS
jgi:hypothetical protein